MSVPAPTVPTMPTHTDRRLGHTDCEPCACGTYKADHCRHEHDPWTTDSARAG